MNTFVRHVSSFIIFLASASAELSPAATIPPTIVVGNLDLPLPAATQMATLEIFFESENPMGISIGGFQLELSLLGPDDAVEFTDVAAPLSHPYIFAGDSVAPLFALSADGRQLTLGDFLDNGFGEITTGSGLATIQIRVQPEAAGKTYEVRINTDPSASYLAVDTVTFVPFATRDGMIAVVPEPTTITFGLPLALASMCRRAARKSPLGVGKH